MTGSRLPLGALSLGFLLAAGCARSAGAPPTPAAARTTRAMTFNIRYGTADDGADAWPNRRTMVFDVIRAFDPDLLGLQEALRGQLDQLHAALPAYTEVGVGREDGRTAGEYSAILYRTARYQPLEHGEFWFSDTPAVPGSATWGNHITRICTWIRLRDRATGRTFYAYDLHLDHESQPSRERSAGLLASRLAARAHADPVIVMGDFNSGEDNPVYRYLTGALAAPGADVAAPPSPRLTDTFRALHPAATDVGTYHGFTGRTSGDKIDYVLTTHEWTPLASGIVRTSVGGRYPSDHFPVTAELR